MEKLAQPGPGRVIWSYFENPKLLKIQRMLVDKAKQCHEVIFIRRNTAPTIDREEIEKLLQVDELPDPIKMEDVQNEAKTAELSPFHTEEEKFNENDEIPIRIVSSKPLPYDFK